MRSSAALFFFAACAPLAAQDVITWVDGTTTERCRVTDFTTLEVKWTAGSGSDRKSSDQVADLRVEKVRDVYRRGFASKEQMGSDTAENFIGIARQEMAKSPFIAQFGLWEAAKFLIEAGHEAEGFPILDELIEKLPDSGFVPRAYAMKLDYYLATGKAKSAETVAKAYHDAATTKGYPDGYVHEASYYVLLAKAAGGGFKPNELRRELEVLASRTENSHPLVANRCRLQIAHILRQEGKPDEALALYNRICESKAVDQSTLAGAMLGIGHVHLARGNEVDKEPYREAMLAFLHVCIDTPNASPDIVAEALFHGAEAALKWGGTDHRLIHGRLRHMLRSDARYDDTEWAKRL